MAASFCWRDGGGMGGIPFAVCLTELRGSGNGGWVFPAVRAVWINGKQFNSRSQYGKVVVMCEAGNRGHAAWGVRFLTCFVVLGLVVAGMLARPGTTFALAPA